MNPHSVLEEFRQFLLLNFDEINKLLSDDLVADWLQANWEIIVESRLQESSAIVGLIDVYGDGADCKGDSSRVSLPDMLPRCSIKVKNDFVLHSFGTVVDGYYVQSPPFDFVKGENRTSEVILPLAEAHFEIGETYDNIAT